MSKADEMFEKLGYEKVEDNSVNALYKSGGTILRQTITFLSDDFKTITKRAGLENGFINMQELQAINEKVKELGWNE